MRMRGLVVVITGASSGIGRATALACARRGARVVLAARSEESLRAVAAQCSAAHREAEGFAVPTDVTDVAAVHALAAAATSRYGRIDVWVNSAAVGILGRFDQMPPAELRRLLDVNLLGAVHGARAAIPVMHRQGHGLLIDIASMLGGAVQAPYMSGYAMSKAALTTFDHVLRQELSLIGAHGITVCSMLPGAVDTPFFHNAANHTGRRLRSMPPVATPERVARAVVGAVRRPRRRVLVGPYTRLLALAYALAPRLVRSAVTWRTEHAYFGAPGTAPQTTGTLYTPSARNAAVRGGRGSGWRTALRRGAAAAAAGGATALVVRATARSPGLPQGRGRR
ncbi:SDR family NAD(P)-dependent oxidoreductase [Streptomyces sp. NPDC003038]|uniref:SDR family NAD(P)-dependent oxidoreductase n=1 Tax=unclassified Streptomyces TaxID=2593676 RepID=UPI0033B3B0B1